MRIVPQTADGRSLVLPQQGKLKIILLIIFLGIVDQYIKYVAIQLIRPLQMGPITIQASTNTLAVFNLPIPNSFIAVISFLIISLLGYWLYRSVITNSKPLIISHWALAIIIAGGLSNLLDRLLRSGVTDTFTINALNLNLADIYIAFGIGILFLSLLSVRNV